MELHYLAEKYLMAEFKFGYELEAIDKDKNLSNIKRITGKPSIETDVSVHPDKREGTAFEYKSEPMPFTPANIQKVESFLASLPSNKIYNNKTCGFHVHFSWPRITSQDAFWVLINIAMNETKKQEFLKFNNVSFFNAQYASVGFLDALKKAAVAGDAKELKKLYEPRMGSKERVFRIHPQGTVEWRGPRGFIPSSGSFDAARIKIRQFFVKTYNMLSFFSESLSKTSVGTVERTKIEELLKGSEDPFTHNTEKIGFAKEMDKEKIQEILTKAPWLRKAKFKDAVMRIDHEGPILESGSWMDGDWQKGTFQGYWYGGTFIDGRFTGHFMAGNWKGGHFLSPQNAHGQLMNIYLGTTNGKERWSLQRLTPVLARTLR